MLRLATAAGPIFLVAIDRLLKMAVEQPFFDGSSARIGWRFVAFERFHNSGVAFGLPVPFWIVLPLTAVFLVWLVVWARQTRARHAHAALAAIFFGAASNAFDRIMYGYTIDYLRIIDSIINCADVMIVGGIFLLIFYKRQT